MSKKIMPILFVISLISVVFIFSACSSSEGGGSSEKKLIGNWTYDLDAAEENEEYYNPEEVNDVAPGTIKLHGSFMKTPTTIKIYSDGTCQANTEWGIWKCVDGKLMLLGSDGGSFFETRTVVGNYPCDGDSLEIYNAELGGKATDKKLIYKKES